MSQNNNEYGAGSIRVLEGLEAVRVRPGMYIGSTSISGLHQLVYEVVDNSVDEAMAGFCTDIDVVIDKEGGVTVTDNGRGIPVAMHEKGKSSLEIALTVLHAGGKFDGDGYKVSGGLHGVGVSCVNALSVKLQADVYRDGHHYRQTYSRGIPQTEVTMLEESDRHGTVIYFFPDSEIFTEMENGMTFDFHVLRDRLRQLAFLNSGLRINFTDERGEEKKFESFCYEGGIKAYVKELNEGKEIVHEDIIGFTAEQNDPEKAYAYAEIALQYTESYHDESDFFANNIHTADGGAHREGFRSGLTRVVTNYAASHNMLDKLEKLDKDAKLTGDDIREGITAVVSVKLPNPEFEGQTKSKLGSAYIRSFVDSVVTQKLGEYFEEHPETAKIITGKAVRSAEGRIAAKKAKEAVNRKSPLESSSMPGKLADCSSKERDKCEIFIVEGDSAGGSAKEGRDRRYQAILPLRGKILNVEKASDSRIFDNAEIRAMITAFGTGIDERFRGEENSEVKASKLDRIDRFDISKLRYDKIICMTDADVDGSHIRVLLLTFFYRYMRELIQEGHIYVAMPPLFRVRKKGKGGSKDKDYYIFREEEMKPLLAELGVEYDEEGKAPKDIEVQRYKGLGEMDAEQLADTTMNPETRSIVRVTMSDAKAAEEAFVMLMGNDVEPRRKFIAEYAKLANIDA